MNFSSIDIFWTRLPVLRLKKRNFLGLVEKTANKDPLVHHLDLWSHSSELPDLLKGFG
jgi:hypothetical protein